MKQLKENNNKSMRTFLHELATTYTVRNPTLAIGDASPIKRKGRESDSGSECEDDPNSPNVKKRRKMQREEISHIQEALGRNC